MNTFGTDVLYQACSVDVVQFFGLFVDFHHVQIDKVGAQGVIHWACLSAFLFCLKTAFFILLLRGQVNCL